MSPLLGLILATGMLVVVPAGLRLIRVPPAVARWWWPGAAGGAVSLVLDRGGWAAGAALLYAGAAALLAVQAVVRRGRGVREFAVRTALATPAVAAVALVAERAGHRLWGYDLDILALTVAHFHFAGFAAALVAGLTSRAVADGALARATALSVPLGTLLVLGGYFVGDYAELVGALVLTAGMWLVGWLTLTRIRPADVVTRSLLSISATVLAVSMVLALWWATGEATGLPRPSLEAMVATHGVANAFGFGLCAIAAWLRLRPEPL
ncbi:YndJ family protein [Streptosporangium sp. KLBMP 9127]|nr:YndJ family protein [Streptosporangium sp. KLBMP 9127]